ncbi:MAG: response receiver sensor histidine kinase response regulator [Gemmatimonadetes bacterium]|nr:response receiver sensor histidine kinase response regulator [Gemmatimonadota bacterium]
MIKRPDVIDHPARVLIVDDERLNRELLVVMLDAEGFELQMATSGEQALAMVAMEPPDLILLDIKMPGLDGYQVTAALKENPATRSIPIIMISALDDRNARMVGLLAGAEDFLIKPVDRAELTVRVRNLLRLKAYGDYHDKYSQMLEGEIGSRTADLVESERLYRSTFDAAPVGIVHVGLQGEWLKVNQRLCDILGYSRSELEGHDVSDIMQPDEWLDERDSREQMVAGTIENHVIEEKRYRRQSGTYIWARVNMSVHRDAEGRAQHFISVIEDITERRVLEAQIRQANKMDAIGRLASGVAHDFNNLLTVILGFAELAGMDHEMASRHGKELSEIIKAAESAAGLTKQLLAFGRQQVLHDAPLDLNQLIDGMVGMLRRLIGEHVDIVLNLAPDLCPALADRNQVEQVVMNLVVNARDAMPAGGRITIETAEAELENSEFHDEEIRPGQYVMLSITDTGDGMSRETLRRLFEPFYTTKETGKGTGLGLSTTYGIVKQSNGYLWVYSELERGTTFKVYLPRGKGAPMQTTAFDSQATLAPRGTETVLLVEDEPGVRKLSKRILDNAGYHVLEANDGDDAEALFAEHLDEVDLLVTDVIMPGCGGPELFARLQRKAPSLRVMYMSGYPKQSAVHGLGIEGDISFVQKPFTAAEFARQVRCALDL